MAALRLDSRISSGVDWIRRKGRTGDADTDPLVDIDLIRRAAVFRPGDKEEGPQCSSKADLIRRRDFCRGGDSELETLGAGVPFWSHADMARRRDVIFMGELDAGRDGGLSQQGVSSSRENSDAALSSVRNAVL